MKKHGALSLRKHYALESYLILLLAGLHTDASIAGIITMFYRQLLPHFRFTLRERATFLPHFVLFVQF